LFLLVLIGSAWLLALAATGFIWVRYSFVINPVNPSLAAVGVAR
jgi:Mitochondrial pyruvate carriers